MSLHESQSLFIEMQLVKSREFSIFLEKYLGKNSIKMEKNGIVIIYLILDLK